MSEDPSMRDQTRSVAAKLLSCVLNFNFIVLLEFWNTILGKIDRNQRRLQDPTMNFRKTAADLECLMQELIKTCSNFRDNAAKSAKAKCRAWALQLEEEQSDVR